MRANEAGLWGVSGSADRVHAAGNYMRKIVHTIGTDSGILPALKNESPKGLRDAAASTGRLIARP